MIAVYFLMGALALLIAMLLFGFVGCGKYLDPSPPTPDPEPPPIEEVLPPDIVPPPYPLPDYGDYGNWITRTKDLVAYWRLGEPATITVLKATDPIPAGAVKTAKTTSPPWVVVSDKLDGYHLKLNPVTTPDNARHSPKTAGEVIPGVTPGLLQISPQENYPCLQLDGGFVQVPWSNELNPPAFTLEAWVSPSPTMFDPAPGAQQFYYCLVESAGPPGLGQKKTGWGLYLGPENPVAPLGQLFWQVWMGDGSNFNRVAVANPGRTQLKLTYLALTFDGNQNLQLWLYCPDTDEDLDLLDKPVLKILINPFTFLPNDGTAAGKGEFIIGAGSNLFPNVAGTPGQRLYPFRGKIQDVALYKSVLPGNILESHYLAGGNL